MQRALKEAFKGVPFEVMNSSGGGVRSGSGVRGSAAKGKAGGPSPICAGEGAAGLTTTTTATEPESIRGVREALNLPPINHDKWLTLPRKYTRMVSRFELPIDSTELSRKHISLSQLACLPAPVLSFPAAAAPHQISSS